MPNPPVDPALEERVARALRKWLCDNGFVHPQHFDDNDARAALAYVLQARSDEVVVTLSEEEAEALDMAADFRLMMRHKASATWPTENLFSARAKLSTALESE